MNSPSLAEKEEQVLRIEGSLKTYKNAFNFVGIFEGFNKLHTQKVRALWGARIGLGGEFKHEVRQI